MKNKGFTLIELLVGIGVFSIIGTIILSILFITLRVSKKSDVLVELKQSGNTAMSQVVKQIRYAKSLDFPTDCTTVQTGDIIITSSLDNAQTTLSCMDDHGDAIASNGASLLDPNISVDSCSFTCSQATLNDPPTIVLKFSLSENSGSNLSETTGIVPFQTSVIMRNYTR